MAYPDNPEVASSYSFQIYGCCIAQGANPSTITVPVIFTNGTLPMSVRLKAGAHPNGVPYCQI
jgi:hypothetical protein